MTFIKNIEINNYRCFRKEVKIEFEKSNIIIGPNNSGKTAILSAIRCFFDSQSYRKTDLNQSIYAAKQTGYNRSDISITFDLTFVPGKLGDDLRKRYSSNLRIRKSFTYRETAGTTNVAYHLPRQSNIAFESLEENVQRILKAVSISYIHPQEGELLLRKAQEKFKQRLFSNWGRHPALSTQLQDLQDQWNKLRLAANSYLSAALTDNLRKVWPNSTTKVGLPDKIQDIVAISDISFRSSSSLPEITLTSHGTGAQSIILYQTHYLLDSDRSLHRGFYIPIWLLEEPETFLHAEICIKLGSLLASDEWLNNIQMFITTHSPLILATSRRNEKNVKWITVESHIVKDQTKVDTVTASQISKIGQMMGDAYFEEYFTAAQPGPLVFLEDSRLLTKKKVEEINISITKGLNGTPEVKRYVELFLTVKDVISKCAIFILDNDEGLDSLESFIKGKRVVQRYSQ